MIYWLDAELIQIALDCCCGMVGSLKVEMDGKKWIIGLINSTRRAFNARLIFGQVFGEKFIFDGGESLLIIKSFKAGYVNFQNVWHMFECHILRVKFSVELERLEEYKRFL